MSKFISKQDEWNKVISELENESDKLQSYDYTIIDNLKSVKNLKILDYGAGPAVMATSLRELGADIRVYEVSKEMITICQERLGYDSVYKAPEEIPNNYFDVILCNLVVCIIEEKEVIDLLSIVEQKLCMNGTIYIGFCNPRIFNIKESKLDFRIPTGCAYECNHDYKKIKKEGNYEIVEKHRPIEWYEKQFKNTGFKVINTLFTPKYLLHDYEIQDFIIFELMKT